MDKKELMYEGKAKKVYSTEDPAFCIVSYKDDATAFNGEKKGTIVGKGVVNNRMSNFMFKLLEKNGIPTDFVEELNDREQKIIILRYGLDGKDAMTQKNVAKMLGISRSYVSRIETKALKQLRKRFETSSNL